uniref:Uncharacterized protein n=1 Tax=Amphimedon queenslandica TaxID=400682 RepID=A0A1X7VIR4_AMPQE
MWLTEWKKNMISERKQWTAMKNDLEAINVKAESVHFTFTGKQGGEVICPAPLAYIVNLKEVIFHLLDELK